MRSAYDEASIYYEQPNLLIKKSLVAQVHETLK